MAVHTNTGAVHDALWGRVEQIFVYWTDLLEMNWLHLSLRRSDVRHAEEADTFADTGAMWQYRSANITAYLPALANLTDPEIEAVIVHELVHVLINPMESALKNKDTPQCELAVENVATALCAAHGRKYIKPLP